VHNYKPSPIQRYQNRFCIVQRQAKLREAKVSAVERAQRALLKVSLWTVFRVQSARRMMSARVINEIHCFAIYFSDTYERLTLCTPTLQSKTVSFQQ